MLPILKHCLREVKEHLLVLHSAEAHSSCNGTHHPVSPTPSEDPFYEVSVMTLFIVLLVIAAFVAATVFATDSRDGHDWARREDLRDIVPSRN